MKISKANSKLIIAIGNFPNKYNASSISKAIKISTCQANKKVNQLAEEGFITKTKKDKRSNILCLTEKGEKLNKALKEIIILGVRF